MRLYALPRSARSIAIGNHTLTIRTFLFSPPSQAHPPACTASFCVCFFYRPAGRPRRTSLPRVHPPGPCGAGFKLWGSWKPSILGGWGDYSPHPTDQGYVVRATLMRSWAGRDALYETAWFPGLAVCPSAGQNKQPGAATMPQPATLRLVRNAAALAAASPTLLVSDW